MIEMEVREHDIGHLAGRGAESRQALHEHARAGGIGVRADAGVDERETVPTPDEKATHVHREAPLLIEELAVLLPLELGLVEHVLRSCLEAPVRHAVDGYIADLHVRGP